MLSNFQFISFIIYFRFVFTRSTRDVFISHSIHIYLGFMSSALFPYYCLCDIPLSLQPSLLPSVFPFFFVSPYFSFLLPSSVDLSVLLTLLFFGNDSRIRYNTAGRSFFQMNYPNCIIYLSPFTRSDGTLINVHLGLTAKSNILSLK